MRDAEDFCSILNSAGGHPKALDDLARMFNSDIRGWINCYGRFCPSSLQPTLGTSNDTWLDGLRKSASPRGGACGDPGIGFYASHSANLGYSSISLCFMDTAEQCEPDDAKVSRPVLRERGGGAPRATRLVIAIKGRRYEPSMPTVLFSTPCCKAEETEWQLFS